MINNKFKTYLYAPLDSVDEYGQATFGANPQQVKMAIYTASQTVTENPRYNESTFVGLTHDKNINDTCLVQLEDESLLKVLYVNREGRLNQVFMGEYI